MKPPRERALYVVAISISSALDDGRVSGLFGK